MSHQIRIANEDIELCKQDKRKRYGIEAVGKITKGTVFKYRTAIEDRFVSASVEFGKFHAHVGSAQAAMIEGQSSVKPAETAKEVFMLHDTPMHCADDVVEFMVKTGMLSLNTLGAAIRAWEESL